MVVTVDKGQLRINKYNYELAVLEQLKEFLRFKAIWVNRSYRYRNSNNDLPKDFYENQESYYNLLNLPLGCKKFTLQFKSLLIKNLTELNTNIPHKKLVIIKNSKIGNKIKVTPSDPQVEPDNIIKLQQEITNNWSSIHLIDILKESDLRINFIKELKTICKDSSIKSSDLQKRLLLCIFGIGSNTGLKRISIANEDFNYSHLRYVKNRHINAITIRNAISIVVNNV